MLSETEAISKLLMCPNLEVYCDYYSITIDDIRQTPKLAGYILEHMNELEQLIMGYHEMERINQAVCDEFQHCEQECQFIFHDESKD